MATLITNDTGGVIALPASLQASEASLADGEQATTDLSLAQVLALLPGGPPPGLNLARSGVSGVSTGYVVSFAAPPAAGVNLRAAIPSDSATITSGLTQPTIPRTLQIVFHATWDGGDVTVLGTAWDDSALSETFTAVAGTTVQGVKAFKTVTSIAHSVMGTGSTKVATVQTGPRLGVEDDVADDSAAVGYVDGVYDAVTVNATNNTASFATAPNGTRNFTLICNVRHTNR